MTTVAVGVSGEAGWLPGPYAPAELRMIAVHIDSLLDRLGDLTPARLEGVRDDLLELTTTMIQQRAGRRDADPAAELAQAARDFVDRHLSDGGLGPAMLASELNVSTRTLQRAFATTNEAVTTYIRRRRLEQARRDLADPRSRMTITEIAARWQFADSSHFIRAFTKHFGITPGQYARTRRKAVVRPAAT